MLSLYWQFLSVGYLAGKGLVMCGNIICGVHVVFCPSFPPSICIGSFNLIISIPGLVSGYSLC